jgi:hypothetical protein
MTEDRLFRDGFVSVHRVGWGWGWMCSCCPAASKPMAKRHQAVAGASGHTCSAKHRQSRARAR